MKKGLAGVLLCILLLGSAGALAQTVTMDTVFYSEGAYAGFVADGLPNGYGYFTGYDGTQCMGMFKDDMLSGYGIYIMDQSPDSPYLFSGGSYENYALNGEGALVYKDGRRTAGQFAHGQPVQGATQTSQGTYTITTVLHNGGTYVGEVLSSAPAVPHGYGVLSIGYAVGSADAHTLMFIGEMDSGNPRSGVYVDIYADDYRLSMVTDGVQGAATQTALTPSAAAQNSALTAGAACSTCGDTQICLSCKGTKVVPSLLGGYGACVTCNATGLCSECTMPSCWACKDTRICSNCNGQGEYSPIQGLRGSEPVTCSSCRGSGVCSFCR
jgi:hypothetical protein